MRSRATTGNLGGEVTPDDIKALRKTLRCTPHELGEALGVDRKTVMAWEQDSLFPTRRYIRLMAKLAEQGPGAVPRKRRGSNKNKAPLELLADPELWRLIRKLLAHPELRRQVGKLAAAYDDPHGSSNSR